MGRLVRFTISSPTWGDVLVARPLPDPQSFWGVLSPLEGTPWGDLLPIVSGEVFSHALHGRVTPLMQQIGRPPHAQLKLLPEPKMCSNEGCVMADPNICHPCAKMPDCYEPPGLDSDEARRAASQVALCWRDRRYVILVEGQEFSL